MSFFWRATLNWKNTFLNTFGQNVLHFEDPTDARTAEQMAGLIDANFWGLATSNEWLRGWTSTNVTLQSISMQRLAPAPPQAGIPVTALQNTGNVGVQVVHPSAGFCFTLKDGLAGRAHRGRFFHYGTTVNHLGPSGPVSGIFGPTGIPALIGRWITSFVGAPSTGIHWCLFHRNPGGGPSFTRVTSIQLSLIYAIQKRRRVGIGL